jgi:hypothetical protein
MGRRALRAPRPLPIILTAAVILTAGCGPSTKQYAQYGEAGTVYAAAMDRLLIVSRDLFIDAHSEKLLQDRQLAFDQAIYDQFTRNDAAYIEVAEELRDHTRQLARYFGLLQQLATSDAPERFGQSLRATAENVDALGDKLRGRPLFGKAAIGEIGPLTTIIVSGSIRESLGRELRDRNQIIRAELETQQILLRALAAGIKNDLENITTLQKARLVTEPLKTGEALQPPNQDRWVSNRRKVLTASTTANELAIAADNVKTLQELYEGLMRGKVDAAAVNNLVTDLESLLSVAESLRSLTGAQQ